MCNTGFNMKRFLFLALLYTMSGQVFAQNDYDMSDEARKTDVYTSIPEIITHQYATDKNIIRYYFSFTCPYCKQVESFISVWGKSLPRNLLYAATPVVDETDSSRMLAVAYHFVKQKALNDYYLDKFVTNIYTHIHKISNTDELARLIKESMVDAKVNIKDFITNIRDPKFVSMVNDLKRQQDSYGLTVTPTVVVGAQYLTHLGLAEGDPTRFIEILNAIVNLQLYSSAGIQ